MYSLDLEYIKFLFSTFKMKNILLYIELTGTHGSVIGLDTLLQAGRSGVRVPMRWVFSI
jgi:hypothetical protein